jgi:hypothetical protein
VRVTSLETSLEAPFRRRPSSSLGRIPDESRENDMGFVGVKGSISSGMLVPRRLRLGTGSLDSSLPTSDPFVKDALAAGSTSAASTRSASTPIGIGRIGAENVPLRPQVKYGRRNAEGTYNFEETLPRKPKIVHKYGSGDWDRKREDVEEEADMSNFPKSEPNSPVSPPLLEGLSKRRNSDGTSSPYSPKKPEVGSPRHLGTLTELEVVDEDSNESINDSSNEDNSEGDKNRPKKRRISSCSSGTSNPLPSRNPLPFKSPFPLPSFPSSS